ncbi:MAG: NAD(P)H-dependent oxidoreductase [Gemmatimonadales bacterium]
MNPHSDSIRIAVVIGSVRPDNYTSKAVALVVDEIRKHPEITLDLIDPAQLNLPLPGTDGAASDAKGLQERVAQATGVILSTPEYHGGYSSVIKLVIENLGFPSALAGKPVALLGVAAGQIGAIKSLEYLRGVCSHVGAIVLPGPVSVAKVRDAFDEAGRVRDERVEQRIRGVAMNLIDYIRSAICPGVALEAMVREGE